MSTPSSDLQNVQDVSPLCRVKCDDEYSDDESDDSSVITIKECELDTTQCTYNEDGLTVHVPTESSLSDVTVFKVHQEVFRLDGAMGNSDSSQESVNHGSRKRHSSDTSREDPSVECHSKLLPKKTSDMDLLDREAVPLTMSASDEDSSSFENDNYYDTVEDATVDLDVYTNQGHTSSDISQGEMEHCLEESSPKTLLSSLTTQEITKETGSVNDNGNIVDSDDNLDVFAANEHIYDIDLQAKYSHRCLTDSEDCNSELASSPEYNGHTRFSTLDSETDFGEENMAISPFFDNSGNESVSPDVQFTLSSHMSEPVEEIDTTDMTNRLSTDSDILNANSASQVTNRVSTGDITELPIEEEKEICHAEEAVVKDSCSELNITETTVDSANEPVTQESNNDNEVKVQNHHEIEQISDVHSNDLISQTSNSERNDALCISESEERKEAAVPSGEPYVDDSDDVEDSDEDTDQLVDDVDSLVANAEKMISNYLSAIQEGDKDGASPEVVSDSSVVEKPSSNLGRNNTVDQLDDEINEIVGTSPEVVSDSSVVENPSSNLGRNNTVDQLDDEINEIVSEFQETQKLLSAIEQDAVSNSVACDPADDANKGSGDNLSPKQSKKKKVPTATLR